MKLTTSLRKKDFFIPILLSLSFALMGYENERGSKEENEGGLMQRSEKSRETRKLQEARKPATETKKDGSRVKAGKRVI